MFVLNELTRNLPSHVPFVGPETLERERSAPFVSRLGANESVFGPSQKAIEAMQREAVKVWRYGDPENHDLRQALAKHLGVKDAEIIIGEGIDGLLGYLTRMIVRPGTKVVTSLGAYPTFSYHVTGYGGELINVPYRDNYEDIEALLEAADHHQASLVYLANPDNPMGTFHQASVISDAIQRVPETCLLIIDEAYFECVPDQNVPPLNPDDQRVIRMRTFSKTYGMAGARVGYAIAHRDLVAAFNRVRNHFGMCRISQEGALAALDDQDHISRTQMRIAESKNIIMKIAESNDLDTIDSAANFVAINCGRDGEFAQRVLQSLSRQGVFVRMPFVAPLNQCIRVTVGPKSDMLVLDQALPKALCDARA